MQIKSFRGLGFFKAFFRWGLPCGILLWALIFWCISAFAYTETFYLSASGDASAPETIAGAWDMSDIATDGTHWDTDDQDDGKLGPNDLLIVLDDDGVFRTQLTTQGSGISGKPITIVGESGGSPVLNGANLITPGSSWTDETGNIWSASIAYDPWEVFFDTTRGTEEALIGSLNAENEWFWVANTLSVYSTSDPDTAYTAPGIQLPWRKCIYNDGNDYITFEDLRLTLGYHGVEALNGASNIIFDNCEIDYNYIMGITYNDVSGPAGDLWTVNDCTIHNNGHVGVWAAEYATNWTIEDNTVYENCDNDASSAGAGIKVQRPSSSGHIVQSNTCYDNGKNTTVQYHGAGIWLDECQPDTDITVRYNTLYGNQNTGINIEKTSGSHVYYNLSYDNKSTTTSSSSGISIIGTNAESSEDNEIYNNTCYDNEFAGISVTGNGVDSIIGNLIRNNILIDNDTYEFDASAGGENDGTNGSGNVYEYNCFGVESATFIRWGTGVTKSTYDAWETAYGSGTNSVEADPLFTDATGDDFILQANSPCIDAGVDVGLTTDYAGNPIQSTPDMGAYEFQPPAQEQAGMISMFRPPIKHD